MSSRLLIAWEGKVGGAVRAERERVITVGDAALGWMLHPAFGGGRFIGAG